MALVNKFNFGKTHLTKLQAAMCNWLIRENILVKEGHKLSLVLHISPITFLGDGSSGPLSLCPDVKYNHPFQNPTRVVFTRNGSFPTTDHF